MASRDILGMEPDVIGTCKTKRQLVVLYIVATHQNGEPIFGQVTFRTSDDLGLFCRWVRLFSALEIA